MVCKNCGGLINVGDKFCNTCGNKLERTCYSFPISPDKSQVVFSLIETWLNQYNYKMIEENGEKYYKENLYMMCMAYYYVDNNIIIYAWKRALNGNDVSVEEAVKSPTYLDELNQLFESISSISNNPAMAQEVVEFQNQIYDEKDKKMKKECNIALGLSIVEVLLSFIGLTWGLIILVYCFIIAISGFKKYKGKCITIIILNIISFLLLLTWMA